MRDLTTVLAIGGWDPTGGAGIVADTKAIHSCGAYALTALTAQAVQSATKVLSVEPVKAKTLEQTLYDALKAFPIHAVKTGMLANKSLAAVVHAYVDECDAPWVCDPVVNASDGTNLSPIPGHRIERKGFTVATPNRPELLRMTGKRSYEAALGVLFERGFDAVVLKGGHAEGEKAIDELCFAGGERVLHERTRYDFDLHGSGCTYASAIAAFLSAGATPAQAFLQAETFMDAVWESAWRLTKRRAVSVLPVGVPAPVLQDG